MKFLIACFLVLGLAACATGQQSACPPVDNPTGAEALESPATPGAHMARDVLAQSCGQSAAHHPGHHVDPVDEAGAKDFDGIGGKDPLAFLKSLGYVASNLPWHAIF